MKIALLRIAGTFLPIAINQIFPDLLMYRGKPSSLGLFWIGLVLAPAVIRDWRFQRDRPGGKFRYPIIQITDWSGNRLRRAPLRTKSAGAWIGVWRYGSESNNPKVVYLPGWTIAEALAFAQSRLEAIAEYGGEDNLSCRWMKKGLDDLLVTTIEAGVDPIVCPCDRD